MPFWQDRLDPKRRRVHRS